MINGFGWGKPKEDGKGKPKFDPNNPLKGLPWEEAVGIKMTEQESYEQAGVFSYAIAGQGGTVGDIIATAQSLVVCMFQGVRVYAITDGFKDKFNELLDACIERLESQRIR